MRYFVLFLITIAFSFTVQAQQERDTTLSRCPVSVTDTVSANNYFIEARPAVLKVYRVKGDLTIRIEQRDQFFTLLFHSKRLKSGNYEIESGSRSRREIEATYSFRSGDQVAYIELNKGTIQCSFDKTKNMWRLKVNGTITNLADQTLSYYRVKADLWVK
ncbi:MAG TPA: hypothetical protein VMZ03_13355 [Chitinophagaceae bacterium]|nr:hypothetical protein [Chitinophagaceae bacterium]